MKVTPVYLKNWAKPHRRILRRYVVTSVWTMKKLLAKEIVGDGPGRTMSGIQAIINASLL